MRLTQSASPHTARNPNPRLRHAQAPSPAAPAAIVYSGLAASHAPTYASPFAAAAAYSTTASLTASAAASAAPAPFAQTLAQNLRDARSLTLAEIAARKTPYFQGYAAAAPADHAPDMDKEDCSTIDIKADLRLSPYPHMLLGENVWLRPVFPQDAPSYFPIFTNPEKMKYFGTGRTRTMEECCTLISHMAQSTHSFSHVPEDFFKEDSVKFYLSFFNHKGPSGIVIISKAQDLDEDYLEIAYCGQGGTGEAVKIVLNYFKDFLFVATAHPKNKASIKILTDNSFELEKENITKYGSVRNYYVRPLLEEPIYREEH